MGKKFNIGIIICKSHKKTYSSWKKFKIIDNILKVYMQLFIIVYSLQHTSKTIMRFSPWGLEKTLAKTIFKTQFLFQNKISIYKELMIVK